MSNPKAKWSIRLLIFLIIIAFCKDFIVGEIPIYCKIDNQYYFPAFKKKAIDWRLSNWSDPFINAKWKDLPYQEAIFPLIPYSATALDRKNRNYKSPFDTQEVPSFQYRHWLGTDKLGRDIAAGLVSGLDIALKVGILSMLLASIIGVFLGGIAGYFGDDRAEVSLAWLILHIIALFFGIFWGIIARQHSFSEGFFITEFIKAIGIIALFLWMANYLAKLLDSWSILSKKIRLPIDLMVMRLIEIIDAIPGLLLILAIVAIVKKATIFTIIFIIGAIGWIGIARFIRAELLKIRNIGYIQAAQAMGFGHWRILFKHALPNAIGPVLITIAFGIARAILAEASLSFLGIGVPSDQVTWGALLTNARSAPSAWWLAIFPGTAIFIMIYLFNIIGDGLKEAIDYK